jgi:hypothetical protein
MDLTAEPGSACLSRDLALSSTQLLDRRLYGFLLAGLLIPMGTLGDQGESNVG